MNRAIAPTNGRAQKHEILFTGRTSVKMMFSEDTNLKQKEENWNQLIKEKGLELINMEAKQSEEAVLLLMGCRLLNILVCICARIFTLHTLLQEIFKNMYCLKLDGKPGVKIYRNFYAEKKKVSNGVLAICVSKLAAQPSLSLASILFGLSYGGVRSTVPQHGAIFDIRVADGYGTTWWSKDGTKLGTLLSTPNLSACNAGFLVKSTD
ncbi:hypothetical protein SADUNF_Sadunf17G0013500 [Salix dunnii]|uniref:Uncharacterized protein n=1 Tax=Salix dunnii TaxID=1413687 RepID=A0A835MGW9_9ROSI|nr:hypothetical protein SADUNF_Sadunf17G0013500 [Salix dunnii]